VLKNSTNARDHACTRKYIHRLKYLGLFGQNQNRYFRLFFSCKPNSFRGAGGFCWPIGVTAALLGRVLPSDGHKLVKKPEI
jgi:hypothetical protein